MTDVHSHILFNIDDGSYSIEESIILLKELKSIGFTNVILTPHYIKGSEYSANNQIKLERFTELKEEIKKQNIEINIYLGNEIFVCNNILELLEREEIVSLNNTKYLLIELPFHNQILNLEDINAEPFDAGWYQIKYDVIGYIKKEYVTNLRYEDPFK